VCSITADNFLDSVLYNGDVLNVTSGGTQNPEWKNVKTITFVEDPNNGGGRLEVHAHEEDNPDCETPTADLCATGNPQSALIIKCTGGNLWDGYMTNTNPCVSNTKLIRLLLFIFMAYPS
jgi:hypothetical protein